MTAHRPFGAVLRSVIPAARWLGDYRAEWLQGDLLAGITLAAYLLSGVVYLNVDHVCDAIRDRAREADRPPRLVVLDLSAAPIVDMQAAHTLAGLADELTAAGIRVQCVEARASVRDRLRREGVDARLGGVNRLTSVADAVDEFVRHAESTAATPEGER